MSTKTLEKKVQELSNQVVFLRSYIIGAIGKDPEGEYRPEFVEEMLRLARQKQPSVKFTTSADLLARIKKR